jgi:cytochrome c556
MRPVALANVAHAGSAGTGKTMNLRALVAAGLVLLLSGSLAMGGVSVRGVMRTWKARANGAAQMLNGGARYDEAAMRESMRAFAADARAIGARLTGASSASRDLKQRFDNFSAEATAALDLAAASGQLKPHFVRMIAACRSCHDRYAN